MYGAEYSKQYYESGTTVQRAIITLNQPKTKILVNQYQVTLSWSSNHSRNFMPTNEPLKTYYRERKGLHEKKIQQPQIDHLRGLLLICTIL